MTAAELGKVLSLKESYIKTHWREIVNRYEKRDIFLYKKGWGSTSNYGIKHPSYFHTIWDIEELRQ